MASASNYRQRYSRSRARHLLAIILHALGFPDEAMPQLLVHGWWNLGGAKMSKSAGNVIDPFRLSINTVPTRCGYYLTSDCNW